MAETQKRGNFPEDILDLPKSKTAHVAACTARNSYAETQLNASVLNHIKSSDGCQISIHRRLYGNIVSII
jgi:hypothetical protein